MDSTARESDAQYGLNDLDLDDEGAKKAWVESFMKARIDECHESVKLRTFVGTWNVHAQNLSEVEDIATWIYPSSCFTTEYDVICIGLQEIISLNNPFLQIGDFFSYQQSYLWAEHIQECIESHVHASGRSDLAYKRVCILNLVGISMCVFVAEKISSQVRDVRSFAAGVGFLGIGGNKGAVGISMTIFDTPVVFVTSHLSSGRENLTRRNADYQAILDKAILYANSTNEEENHGATATDAFLSFLVSPFSSNSSAALYSSNNSSNECRPWHKSFDSKVADRRHILDNEVIFWLGDLNYHLDTSLSPQEILKMVDERNFDILRLRDQLKNEIWRENAFHAFEEGTLDFAPTYKYEDKFVLSTLTDEEAAKKSQQSGLKIKVSDYERPKSQRHESDIRAPAWCDRILWKVK